MYSIIIQQQGGENMVLDELQVRLLRSIGRGELPPLSSIEELRICEFLRDNGLIRPPMPRGKSRMGERVPVYEITAAGRRALAEEV
jgi:hypothetical protein